MMLTPDQMQAVSRHYVIFESKDGIQILCEPAEDVDHAVTLAEALTGDERFTDCAMITAYEADDDPNVVAYELSQFRAAPRGQGSLF